MTEEVSLKAFEDLCDELFYKKEQIREHDAVGKALAEDRTRLEAKIMGYLEEMEKDSHKGRLGTVYRVKRFSVQTPKTPEDKEAFWAWVLKSKGVDVYRSLRSVNSRTLQAFYKEELEAAGDIDFKMPGVQEPTYSETIGTRKG